MKKILIYFMVFSTFFSCNTKENNGNIYSINPDVITGNPTSVNLSDIAESVNLIKLETRDDALIGYAKVTFADSLLLVSSSTGGFGLFTDLGGGSELFIFDAQTGNYRYKIYGFNDRGPWGYRSTTSAIHDGKVVLEQWGDYGIRNYITGEKTEDELSIPRNTYDHLLFVNDSLLIGNVPMILPGRESKLDLLSAFDGSVVHEYGLVGEIDQGNVSSSHRSILYDHGEWINYYSMICDTIYGINKTTLERVPRIALNLGKRLPPDVKGGMFTEDHIIVYSVCESDRYIFMEFGYGRKRSQVYYDKKSGETSLVDNKFPDKSGFIDDITGFSLPFFPPRITPDGRAYKVMQAVDIVTELGEERAAEMGIKEDDNPVIMVVKLKE